MYNESEIHLRMKLGNLLQ